MNLINKGESEIGESKVSKGKDYEEFTRKLDFEMEITSADWFHI